jgi:RnfABCDGE-type electron transport complex B subunit
MLTATINQSICVKCTLCIDACPFDAIIGSIGEDHTVLLDTCVGCKLCVNPCPVDCIDMVPLSNITTNINKRQIVINAKNKRAAKIARIQFEQTAKLSTIDNIKRELEEILIINK